MTPYLPYIFGAVAFFGGLYLFLLSYRIYIPNKQDEKNKERFENWHQKFGTFGKVASILLILYGAYDLVTGNPEKYKVGNDEKIESPIKKEWTTEDKEQFVNGCIESTGLKALNYPKLVRKYCECSFESIQNALTYEEYIENHNLTQKEHLAIINPIISDCKDSIQKAMNELEKE